MGGALGTYGAALLVIGVSVALGGGVLALAGARRWSWTAPAIGLAAATVLAWWAVRLPGQGTTALVTLALATLLGAATSARRLEGAREAASRGLPLLLTALAICSIPFVVEGHFGVLGTGFNVDMGQHLFAADWLSDPDAAAPGLYEQGYPLGPHALAAAAAALTGNLATAFSGVTIAIPVIIALTALSGLGERRRPAAYVAALAAAFAYLAASYLAQGSFKELFEIAFLLGFALWLAELPGSATADGSAPGWAAGIPGAVLATGALYAYSGPGLAWLGGTLVLWAAYRLLADRGAARANAARALPAAIAALAVLVLLAAPELDRIADFGGSVGTVSEASDGPSEGGGGSGGGDPPPDRGREAKGPKFDNDLGNLFGQISPLEAFGIWPSGDFRVAPGDGAAPSPVFYLGALIGAVALLIGVALAVRRREAALVAALAAAAAIWVAARIGSTPYTAAKALAMLAPLAALIAARGLLDPGWIGTAPPRVRLVKQAFAAAALTGFCLSAALALANAPVGPSTYSPGVGQLSERFAGAATLLVAPAEQLSEEHGDEFYGWELREAGLSCVISDDDAAKIDRASTVFQYFVGVDTAVPPFLGLVEIDRADGVTLWRRADTSGALLPLGRLSSCNRLVPLR